jgi:predicted HNH restriction endonuclease
LRARAIQIHGTRCQACDFSFRDWYGDYGDGFIEVHHTRPLSTFGGAELVNPATDLAVLCSNCHSMIHRRPDACLTVEELRVLVASVATARPAVALP